MTKGSILTCLKKSVGCIGRSPSPPFQDPDGFNEAVEGLDPDPVSAGINRERRKRKGADGSKKKKTKKAKTDKKNAPDTPALSQEDERTVLESFSEQYQTIIRKLPISLRPLSTRHGEHSYTVFLGFDYGWGMI